MRTLARVLVLLCASVTCVLKGAEAQGVPLDTGVEVKVTAEMAEFLREAGSGGAASFLRVRGLEQLKTDNAAVLEVRRALERTRASGSRVVAIVRWPADSWTGGVRQPARSTRLPVDLREAFERCRALAATFGDLVDFWEIDNEPDIGFVEENPETYTAFLKACYLGIGRGRAQQAEDGRRKPEDGSRRTEAGSLKADDGRRKTEDGSLRTKPNVQHRTSNIQHRRMKAGRLLRRLRYLLFKRIGPIDRLTVTPRVKGRRPEA